METISTIRKFDDYRDFLNFQVEKFRKDKKTFSFEQVARKIGTTRSYLKLITDKRRHMSLDKVVAVSNYFKLNEFEHQYFVFLFLKTVAKTEEIRQFFDSILASYRSYERKEVNPMLASTTKEKRNFIYRDWVLMAILELVDFKDFQLETSWIQKKLGGPELASIETISTALTLLSDKKLILQKDGRWQRTKYFDDVSPFDLEEYSRFQVGLQRASLALQRKGKDATHRPNRFQMYCLALDLEQTDELMKIYDEFQKKLDHLALSAKNPQKVMLVSNNAFSLTEE